MNTKFYDFLTVILPPVYNIILPSKVTGIENIPLEGGFVMCANHIHWNDPLFLAARLKSRKRRFVYLAKAEVFARGVAHVTDMAFQGRVEDALDEARLT